MNSMAIAMAWKLYWMERLLSAEIVPEKSRRPGRSGSRRIRRASASGDAGGACITANAVFTESPTTRGGEVEGHIEGLPPPGPPEA